MILKLTITIVMRLAQRLQSVEVKELIDVAFVPTILVVDNGSFGHDIFK